MKEALVILFALGGFWNALYFSLVMHGRARPDTKLVPSLCRPEDNTCVLVTNTPYARLFFGLPNADLGLVYYVGIIAWMVVSLVTGTPPWLPAVAVASLVTVAVSAYLGWALLFRLKTVCPFCFLGHGLNVAIAGVIVWMWAG